MCWAATAWGQQTVLQGGVYFATKDNPLPGVSVMLVNRNGLALSGVNTNENGQFRIPLHSEAETIVFSMIGFKTQELTLSGNTEFEVFLLADLAELEGVEVVAEIGRASCRERVCKDG